MDRINIILSILLKILLIILLVILLMQYSCYAQEVDINRIIAIESNGNPEAISYKGAEKGLGLAQISDICRKDYNAMTGEKVLSSDLLDAKINIKIAHWYIEKRIPQLLKYYNKPITTRNILISYNAGISCVVNDRKLPEETENYIKKYFDLEN